MKVSSTSQNPDVSVQPGRDEDRGAEVADGGGEAAHLDELEGPADPGTQRGRAILAALPGANARIMGYMY